MRSARRGGKSPELEDSRKDFHLAGTIYVQSGHCDFISQKMCQTKVYCVTTSGSTFANTFANFLRRMAPS